MLQRATQRVDARSPKGVEKNELSRWKERGFLTLKPDKVRVDAKSLIEGELRINQRIPIKNNCSDSLAFLQS